MNITSTSVAFVVWAFSTVAQAAVGLAYQAPDDCPAERAFVAAVAARGATFDGATPTSARRVLVVAIRARDSGFSGMFQVHDGETATDKREVEAPSCAEVVDAMAVVAAIALRPEVAATTTPGRASAVAVGTVPAEAHTPPAAPVPESDRVRGDSFTYHRAHESVNVPAGALTFDLARTISLYGGLLVGAAPSKVFPRFDLSMTGGTFVTTPDGAQRLIGPVLRARLSLLGPGSYRSVDTKTDMTGLAFGLGACLTPHYDSAGLVLLFCTDAGVGAMSMRTTGSGGALIQSKSSGFGSIGLGVEAQYNLNSLFSVGIKAGWDVYLGSPPWSAERADDSRILAGSSNSGYLLTGIGFRF